MLLAISAGSAYAGPPPFFRAPDTKHAHDTIQQEAPTAFIQMEKPIFFAAPMWKQPGHHKEHHNSRKPEHLTPDTSGDFAKHLLGRIFIVLNFESQGLLPAPHSATPSSPQRVVVRLPQEAVTINQQIVVFAETSNDVAATANHHLHQFQILLI
jgi:hypothetical protein